MKINGYDVEKHFTKAIERVGAIVENPDLYMYLSGYDNLKLVSNLYKGVDEKRIDEVVKLVKLENRINDKVSKYSLGMRQRLGIAQAILHKPNLLILDEPTNGLDPEGIKEMRDLLIDLANNKKMGILVSSHNLAELDNLCNKVCIIKNGEIIKTSSIDEIKNMHENKQYIIEIDTTENIKKLFSNANILDKKHFKIDLTKENVPSLVEKLVQNNVKIYTIKQEEQTLEDAFFEMTRGNINE